MAEILAEMIDERGSRRSFAEKIGMPPTTLQSMLTRDLGRASISNVIAVCQELGISVERLNEMADGKYQPHTIAAHHNGDEWSEEELEELERFKEFVRSKRKANKE
jgi:hypothetical protein